MTTRGRPARAPSYLSSREAADLCAVDRRTLLRWIERGLLESHQLAGGRHRIRRAELHRFLLAHRMPVPRVLLTTPRVGVVDDDPLLIRTLVRLVRRHLPMVEIQTAADGFTAGVLVAAFRPHLLLLDIQMPGMSGLEVCRRLSREPELSSTAIVIVSAALTPALERELASLGVRQCIAKPFTSGEITSAVDAVLSVGGEP